MTPSSTEILASTLFGLAVLHTFCVKFFARWASRHPEGSLLENLFHFLAETEVVFGLWAASLFLGIAAMEGSLEASIDYINRLQFNEAKFVFVIMVMAATRPVVRQAEVLVNFVARWLPLKEGAAFYLAALSFGTLLGSLITEPAAMTLVAILLKQRFFDRGISPRLAYATLGLLFVNISIGGTLTHFAAPPVLLVAEKWHWDTPFMACHLGWRAAASCLTSTLLTVFFFRKELNNLCEAGLLLKSEEKNRVDYQANPNHAFFTNLQDLIQKYLGLDKLILAVLERMGQVSQIALVGDYARGIDSGRIEVQITGHQLNEDYLVHVSNKLRSLIAKEVVFEVRSSISDPEALLLYSQAESV